MGGKATLIYKFRTEVRATASVFLEVSIRISSVSIISVRICSEVVPVIRLEVVVRSIVWL